VGDAPWDDGSPLRVAWVDGASPDDAHRWLAACFPGRLTALANATGPRFRLDELELLVGRTARGVQLQLTGHDEGFVHELALAAHREGRHALVVDGVHFDSPTAWLAFTDYAPGSAPRTVWYDPLRAPPTQLDDAGAWLSRAAGFTGGVEAFALRFGPVVPLDAERWLLREHAALLPAPRRLPSWADAVREPPGSLSVALAVVTALVALLLLGPAYLALPALVLAAFSAALGPGVAAVAGATLACGAGGAVLSLLPIAWPNGARMRWRVRALLFVLPQLVMPVLWAWRGS
jgi:hypothetical protein